MNIFHGGFWGTLRCDIDLKLMVFGCKNIDNLRKSGLPEVSPQLLRLLSLSCTPHLLIFFHSMLTLLIVNFLMIPLLMFLLILPDPGGCCWPTAYSTWTPTTIAFMFWVSFIIAHFTIFASFLGPKLLKPFWGPKWHFFGKPRVNMIFWLIFSIQKLYSLDRYF